MSHIFYGLCALAALFCTVLLLRAYFHNRYRLLMWGGLCFLGLTLNNALLVVDKFLFPDINLFTWRLLAGLTGMLVLLYGIIFDAEWGGLVDLMLLGAIAMASWVAGLFFLRFWRDTRDRLFLWFAISFLIEGLNRAALGLSGDPNEGRPFFYFVRLLSFLLILVAIVQKNLTKGQNSRPKPASRG